MGFLGLSKGFSRFFTVVFEGFRVVFYSWDLRVFFWGFRMVF